MSCICPDQRRLGLRFSFLYPLVRALFVSAKDRRTVVRGNLFTELPRRKRRGSYSTRLNKEIEIVDLCHGGDRQQLVPDIDEIDSRRHGVQKRIDRLSDDLLDFAGNDDAGRQREDRIDEAPAEEGDQQGAGNHPEIPPLITLAKIGFFSDAGCS